MQNFIQEIIVDGPIYLVLAFISFLNIIAPISGSATQTPLIAAITGDAHYAITVSTWLLMISCGMIAFVFRKDIRKDYFWKLLPTSIIGAVVGALLLIKLPNWLIISVLFFLSIKFLYRKVVHLLSKNKKAEEKKKSHHLVAPAVGLFSSFLQGTGVSGSSIREGFLFSENLKIEEVRGTAELLNFIIFATASIFRFHQNQISSFDMLKWTIIFAPILFIAIYLGRKVLIKLSSRTKDIIIIGIMSFIVIELAVKIVETFF